MVDCGIIIDTVPKQINTIQDKQNNPNVYLSMGETAENVARKYKLSRQEQQEFAISSHQKAHAAQLNEKFNDEGTRR